MFHAEVFSINFITREPLNLYMYLTVKILLFLVTQILDCVH